MGMEAMETTIWEKAQKATGWISEKAKIWGPSQP